MNEIIYSIIDLQSYLPFLSVMLSIIGLIFELSAVVVIARTTPQSKSVYIENLDETTDQKTVKQKQMTRTVLILILLGIFFQTGSLIISLLSSI